jgi:hypothetical protein
MMESETLSEISIVAPVYAVACHGGRWSVIAHAVELSGRSGVRCVMVLDEPKVVSQSKGMRPLPPCRRFYSDVRPSGSRLLLIPSARTQKLGRGA